jgi:serine/threonine-protein kinase HipA
MGLAARVEVDAAQVDVLFESEPPCLLVERYDRRESAGRVIRLHQEDFCQATGRRPERKYEQEGGPSFADCAMVVTRASSDPLLDLQRLMRWQAFNAIVGNCDAHGKNLSLVYDGSRTRLAPFYDLL